MSYCVNGAPLRVRLTMSGACACACVCVLVGVLIKCLYEMHGATIKEKKKIILQCMLQCLKYIGSARIPLP